MRRSVVTSIAGGLLFLAIPSAGAQTVIQQGWWTAANVGGVVPASATGPDVPKDGLLVQGGTSDNSPTAVSALSVAIPSGADVRTLVVHAVSSPANVGGSIVKACRLTSTSFKPAEGGPVSDAPGYDCTGAPTATAGADGVTFSFDARALVAGGTVAVALVPGSLTSRVAFAKPGDDVLLSATPPPPAPETPPANSTASGPVVSTLSTYGGATVPAARTATPAPTPTRSSAPTTSPNNRNAPASPPGAISRAPAAFTTTTTPDISLLAVVVGLALLATASFAWVRPGRVAERR